MGNCCVLGSKAAVEPVFVPNETSGLLNRPAGTSQPAPAPRVETGPPQPHVSNNNQSGEAKDQENGDHDHNPESTASNSSDEPQGPPMLFKVGDDRDDDLVDLDEEDSETRVARLDKDEEDAMLSFHEIKLNGDEEAELPYGNWEVVQYLRVPLPYLDVQRKDVEAVFKDAFDPYNSVLRVLNKLRNHRETLIDWANPHVAPGQRHLTLHSAMIHLATLLKPNIVVQIWRNGCGDLEISYNAKLCPGALRDRLFGIRCACECINKLEVALEKNNPIPQVKRVTRRRLGMVGMDYQIQEVHQHSVEGQQYLKDYWNACRLVEAIPDLWCALNKERNELIKEFLRGFRYIMSEPVSLARPPKQ